MQSYFAAPKVFWSFVNHFRACRSPLPAINVDGSLIHDDLVKISHSLSRIFQLSLCSGTLPQDWISAHIVHVHKKNDKNNPSNYRPTSIVVKILDKLVHRAVISA